MDERRFSHLLETLAEPVFAEPVLVGDVALPQGLLGPAELAAVASRLGERRAAAPTDRVLAAAAATLSDRLAAGRCSPDAASFAPERPIRWDRASVTWLGAKDAGPGLVRCLRAEAANHPEWRAWFAAEADALSRLLPVEHITETAVFTALPGVPVRQAEMVSFVKVLFTGLRALGRYSDIGLSLPALLPEEVRLVGDRVAVVCLTPNVSPTVGMAEAIQSLVTILLTRVQGSDAVVRVARAIAAHPPEQLVEVNRLLSRALGEDLAARRHALVVRWRASRQRFREMALLDLVERLDRAFPAPTGRGAVGVDLDGHITVVESDSDGVRWRAADVVEVVYDPESGFRPPIARRLLRARAMSPPNATLDSRVGGTEGLTEAMCRWVAAGLHLRTVRLLLDRDRRITSSAGLE